MSGQEEEAKVAPVAKRCALYMRVSTAKGASAKKKKQVVHGHVQSVQMQKDALHRYAADRGWRIVGEFEDVGVSGTKASRPRLDALLALVDAREVDVVLVWRFDRFARSIEHLITSLRRLREHDVDFASVTEAIDTSTSIGRMVFHFLAAVAEFEHELISERVTAGIATAQAHGKPFGRKPRADVPIKAAVTLLRSGYTLTLAAEELMMPRRTLQRHLERAGLWPLEPNQQDE